MKVSNQIECLFTLRKTVLDSNSISLLLYFLPGLPECYSGTSCGGSVIFLTEFSDANCCSGDGFSYSSPSGTCSDCIGNNVGVAIDIVSWLLNIPWDFQHRFISSCISSVLLFFAVVTFGQDAYTVNEFDDITIRVLVNTTLTSSIDIGIFTSTSAPAGFATST